MQIFSDGKKTAQQKKIVIAVNWKENGPSSNQHTILLLFCLANIKEEIQIRI